MARPIDTQGYGELPCHGLSSALDAGKVLRAERAEESQGEVKILGMGCASAAGNEPAGAPGQRIADLLVRPEGEKPALAPGVQARRSSNTSRATRTAWWRTSSRLPAN